MLDEIIIPVPERKSLQPPSKRQGTEITELNYDRNFSEYEQYNNNTDWIKAVKKLGAKQQHFLSISGGGEKATMRMSLGYDNETGSIIGQRLDRLTSELNLDYFVSKELNSLPTCLFVER
jgi:hypothetical protein